MPPRGYALERSRSWGATCPARARSHVTTRPKTNPPTWAKNATPPPFAEALNSPKLASISWYKNHSPRKIQAGIRIRKVQVRELVQDEHGEVGHDQQDVDDREPPRGKAV
jgi:hypothetical protein